MQTVFKTYPMSVSPEFHEDKKESIQMMSLDFMNYICIYMSTSLYYIILCSTAWHTSPSGNQRASQGWQMPRVRPWHHEETWVQLDGPGTGLRICRGVVYVRTSWAYIFCRLRSSQKSFKDGITANHHMPACCGHVGALNKACTKHFNFKISCK